MHDTFKKKICKEKSKAKKIKMLLNMIASVFLGDVRVRMYLEGNNPHQTVLIVCECF